MPTKFGQNFLNNNVVVRRIIASAGLDFNDNVLEIGPGKGILTKKLLETVKKVISVEIDSDFKSDLLKKFKDNSNFELLVGDILNINIPKVLSDKGIDNYKVVANIPYYITSKIIRLFLESTFKPEEMILMVQKEVAERIVANKGNMNKLAISVQYYAKPEVLFFVDKSNFTPTPKIDSAIIKIKSIRKNSKNEFDKKFFKFIRAGFCARRKTLVNNLTNSLHIEKQKVEKKLRNLGFDLKIRAQSLSIADWIKIVESFD